MHHLRQIPLGVSPLTSASLPHNSTYILSSSQSHLSWVAILVVIVQPCLLSCHPYCLVTPIGTNLLSLLFIYASYPYLELAISSTLFHLYSLSRVSCAIQHIVLLLLRALHELYKRQIPLKVSSLSSASILHNSTCITSSLQSHHYQVAILAVTLGEICCRRLSVDNETSRLSVENEEAEILMIKPSLRLGCSQRHSFIEFHKYPSQSFICTPVTIVGASMELKAKKDSRPLIIDSYETVLDLTPSGKSRSWGRGGSKIFKPGGKMLITSTCIKQLRKKLKIR